MAKILKPSRSNIEIRKLLLDYFYSRNNEATSFRGKKGSAPKISEIKKELKLQHGLTQQEIQRNLTYLISEGWVEEIKSEKTIKARGGTTIPSITSYYQITAAGIDKIEGTGEFTMPKFQGIKIEATAHPGSPWVDLSERTVPFCPITGGPPVRALESGPAKRPRRGLALIPGLGQRRMAGSGAEGPRDCCSLAGQRALREGSSAANLSGYPRRSRKDRGYRAEHHNPGRWQPSQCEI